MKSLFPLIFCLVLASPAYAYLGPGAGLGMIGSLVAIIVVSLVVVFGLIAYPIRVMRRRRMQSADEGKGG